MKTRMIAALALAAGLGGAAYAATPQPVTIDDTNVYPESMTATASGDLIIGSSGKGTIYRAKAGSAKAEIWIDPKTSGMSAVLGVFADDKGKTLYVCSAALGAPPDKADALSALRTFDLATGAAKAAYPMPGGGKALCNDIAIGKDGAVYVSETLGGQVLVLKKGSSALETWIKDPKLGFVDGIALGGDGAIYVNTVTTGHMYRIPIAAGGAPGEITELTPSVKLGGPDGLRSLGGLRFLQAENQVGRVSIVTVSGTTATVTALKEGEPGITSAAQVKGQVWAINAKMAYRRDPASKGKDPNPFLVEPIPGPAK
jgi:sugar lactone lactonase YvrE